LIALSELQRGDKEKRLFLVKEFIIGKNDAGQRLDRFVAKTVPLLPGSLAQKYIRLKRIKVGGKGSKRDYKLSAGDAVQMYINDEFFEHPNEKNAYLKIASPSLDIIYEDENILLVSKPAGVLCHAGGGYDYSSVIARIQAYLFQKGDWRPRDENAFCPALCNRIDRNTSGIVIAAKNAESLRIINEKIKLREIDKYYLAIVHGAPNPQSGKLEGYIFKDAVKNQVFVSKNSRPGAKTAVTEYRTVFRSNETERSEIRDSASHVQNQRKAQRSGFALERRSDEAERMPAGRRAERSEIRDDVSLLECRLITGRTHQIRAQLADAGHPLLGDGKYGSERLNKPYGEKYQALCSYKLVFAFQTDAGMLQYLDKKTFTLDDVPFVSKYFP
jgi:23S rRNA pseudouridine955/2504/2580 synthase